MKLIPLPHFRRTLARLAVLAALGLGVSSSAFGVVLNFSGGGGAPLSMTIASPVSYTMTGSQVSGLTPFFMFLGVGNIFTPANTGIPLSGNITFSVNGGASQAISFVASGYTGGIVVPNDIFIWGSLPGLTVGNTVVLSAGTLTTTGNFAGAAPASANYQSFIANGNGGNISTFGVSGGGASTPDSGSTAALLGVGLMGLFSLARISRRAA